jgi:hypothetical protein
MSKLRSKFFPTELPRNAGAVFSRIPPVLLLAISLLTLCHEVKGQEFANPFVKDQTDLAMEKAIKFLVTQQNENGSITDQGHDTAMTALAIMAMASVGNQPGDPTPEGECMRKGISFVLTRQQDNGYFGGLDNSRMYGHGIITLMLTEMMGMTMDQAQDEAVHKHCQKAINLILSSQKESKPAHFRGGWRYYPNAKDSDLSVSVWQLMALRSAKNDGLRVPASAIEEAVEYLKRSYVSSRGREGVPDNKVSGFAYMPRQGRPTETMAAAGLLAMQVCGEYESPYVIGAADWLLEHPPQFGKRFFFYGIYYYAQGMYQRGGSHADLAQKHVLKMLMEKQQGDGAWEASNGEEKKVGKVYATSLAVLSLSVEHHFLPIYQR